MAYKSPQLIKIKIPEREKTKILFSESHTIWGNIPTKPAKAAPIPIETSKLGKAQQKIVPKDVNKER